MNVCSLPRDQQDAMTIGPVESQIGTAGALHITRLPF